MALFSSPQGLLCLLALSFWIILQVSGHSQVMDCCVRTSPIPIPAKIVRSYREQHVQEGCLLQAVVFITFRGKHLCAPSHAWWVKHLKVRLDQRRHLKRSPWTPS
ncbi:C-C motif chemokine 19-like [Sceloporus undulatus]|uniref:C-C motif chemokine 19-like n=1 Tax=Sceloporus undulatus TaxID=8520 RepID=UPI001C4C6270|nr:C-C motif chemokine 19-like [Sceloporus undulatus]